MKEIWNLPWNGYNVVSTFSGGGGSCLGYEMAGYHVVWANEFIPEAQNTYRANHPNTFLNTEDIRKVTVDQVIKESGLDVGEIDLFDGSPPCASFSTAGKREKHWGDVKDYSDTKQRVDDLFLEYIRLVKGLQPKTFVAENVSGLVKGTAKGYFKMFLSEMKNCGYEVRAKLLNAKYLGVPQSRERIIFIGVRNDLVDRFNVHSTHPEPMHDVITIGQAFKGLKQDENERRQLIEKYQPQLSAVGRELRKLRKDPDKPLQSERYFNLQRASMRKPCPTITQMGGVAAGVCHPLEDRRFTIPELKRITSIPDDFILTGTYQQQWERLGRMVPPIMMMNISKCIERNILCKIIQ